MKPVAAIRFVLELAAVGAVIVAGAAVSWIVAVVAPMLLIVVWGGLIAPKAKHRLSDPLRLGVEICLFLVVGCALGLAGHVLAGVALAAVSVVVALIVRTTGATE